MPKHTLLGGVIFVVLLLSGVVGLTDVELGSQRGRNFILKGLNSNDNVIIITNINSNISNDISDNTNKDSYEYTYSRTTHIVTCLYFYGIAGPGNGQAKKIDAKSGRFWESFGEFRGSWHEKG